MPGLPRHQGERERGEIPRREDAEDRDRPRRPGQIRLRKRRGPRPRPPPVEEPGAGQRQRRRRQEPGAVVEGGELGEAATEVGEEAGPGILDGAGVPGGTPGRAEVAEEPEGHRRRRDRRVETGVGPPGPRRRRSPPAQQEQQADGGHQGDAEVAGQPGQRAPAGRPEQERPAPVPARSAVNSLFEEPVRGDQGQGGEQQERRLRHRLPRHLGQRRGEGEDQGGPAGDEPRLEPPFQVPPQDEDGQGEERGVQRPGDPDRIQDPQARSRQQERPERRPEGGDAAVEVGEPLPGEQVPGDRRIVDPVRAQPHSPGDLPRQDQPGPERAGERGKQGEPLLHHGGAVPSGGSRGREVRRPEIARGAGPLAGADAGDLVVRERDDRQADAGRRTGGVPGRRGRTEIGIGIEIR